MKKNKNYSLNMTNKEKEKWVKKNITSLSIFKQFFDDKQLTRNDNIQNYIDIWLDDWAVKEQENNNFELEEDYYFMNQYRFKDIKEIELEKALEIIKIYNKKYK